MRYSTLTTPGRALTGSSPEAADPAGWLHVVMPGLGGREMSARLAERWPDVPVLFTSGYTGMDVVRRGLLDEGRDFLQKPLAPEALARKVREMVDSRASRF